MELNTLRNKCSHNWLLKVPVRRGKRPRRRAAERRDELAPFQLIELHSIPSSQSALADSVAVGHSNGPAGKAGCVQVSRRANLLVDQHGLRAVRSRRRSPRMR